MICSYLLSAFISARWITDTQIALFTVAGLLAIRGIRLRRDELRLVAAGGFLVSLLMIIVANHEGGTIGRGVASLWGGLLLLAIVVIILREILAGEVTARSIYGALSAYLIIGLMFASFYAAMYFFNGRTFFAAGQPGDSSNFQYFSFTTLTTLGYGDFTASSNPGRAIAVLEAMTGQIFLATLVAKLVASFRPARRRRAESSSPETETEGPG